MFAPDHIGHFRKRVAGCVDADRVDPDPVQVRVRRNKLLRACIYMYMEILRNLEQALESEDERRVASFLSELDMYENEVQKSDGGKFSTEVHEQSDWPAVETKRLCLQESVACVPLCLSAVLHGPDEVLITCTSLAGGCLASLSMQGKEDRLHRLRTLIKEHAPRPDSGPKYTLWKLVTCDGRILDHALDNLSITEIFLL